MTATLCASTVYLAHGCKGKQCEKGLHLWMRCGSADHSAHACTITDLLRLRRSRCRPWLALLRKMTQWLHPSGLCLSCPHFQGSCSSCGRFVAKSFPAASEASSPADWLPPRVTAHGSSSGLDQPRVFPVHFSDCTPSTAVTSAALSQRTAHKAVVGGRVTQQVFEAAWF